MSCIFIQLFGLRHFSPFMAVLIPSIFLELASIDTLIAQTPNPLSPPAAGTIPQFNPATRPISTGEFSIGVVTIIFKDTSFAGDQELAMRSLDTVLETNLNGDPLANSIHSKIFHPSSISDYFKTYSNGITWPRILMMNNLENAFMDRNFFGFFCEYNSWNNPIGWTSTTEGEQRIERLKRNALTHATRTYRGPRPHFICYNFITTRNDNPSKELTQELQLIYNSRHATTQGQRRMIERSARRYGIDDQGFDPWEAYMPTVNWGHPAWPNSNIQIQNFSGGMLAHEIGILLGAPKLYRVGSPNDGIGGDAILLPYGPTSTAFSRFYHHGFIKELNHPTIRFSGKYTLHPRHSIPQNDEAVGYLIQSSHPHYFYHLEYIHNENPTVGVGSNHQGMLISVINLNSRNFLGPPDFFYVYRPNDPLFLGVGDLNESLFGKRHNRTEFNNHTNPSARLPNQLEGGVYLKNISENDGTLTFEIEIDRPSLSEEQYRDSLRPKIRLDAVKNILPTSFTMHATCLFPGEPIKSAYGFCWATSPNPTTGNSMVAFAHRETYRSRALNLTPNTTYYVRAFATNGSGVRYSDEEITVKTSDPTSPYHEIKPLFTDKLSGNRYIRRTYTNTNSSNFSAHCVFAKIIGYHKPIPFYIPIGGRSQQIDFNKIHWNPSHLTYPPRITETNRFLNGLREQEIKIGINQSSPDRNLLRNISSITGISSKPVITTVDRADPKNVESIIRDDLIQSRPLILLIENTDPNSTNPMQWALIDGVNKDGDFHVDFPSGISLSINNKFEYPNTGYFNLEHFMRAQYKIHVVSSLHY